MCSTYLAALAGSVSDSKEPACAPSPSVKSTPTVAPSSPSTGLPSPASPTSPASKQGCLNWPSVEESTSSAAVSRVKTSVSPERVLVLQARGVDSGAISLDSFASFGPDGWSSKTSQRSLLEESISYSGTWPRSGMTRSGTAYLLPTWAPLTGATESGLLPTPVAKDDGKSYEAHMAMKARMPGGPRYKCTSLAVMARSGMWPTPTAGDAKASGSRNTESSKAHFGVSLTDAVRGDRGSGRMWPTPCATVMDMDSMERLRLSGQARTAMKDRGESYQTQTTGQLNPTWVEWLMGFPLGWTALKHWATRSSRKSRKSSDAPS